MAEECRVSWGNSGKISVAFVVISRGSKNLCLQFRAWRFEGKATISRATNQGNLQFAECPGVGELILHKKFVTSLKGIARVKLRCYRVGFSRAKPDASLLEILTNIFAARLHTTILASGHLSGKALVAWISSSLYC